MTQQDRNFNIGASTCEEILRRVPSFAGVRLLHMEPGNRVAAAVVIPPEEEVNGGLIQ